MLKSLKSYASCETTVRPAAYHRQGSDQVHFAEGQLPSKIVRKSGISLESVYVKGNAEEHAESGRDHEHSGTSCHSKRKSTFGQLPVCSSSRFSYETPFATNTSLSLNQFTNVFRLNRSFWRCFVGCRRRHLLAGASWKSTIRLPECFSLLKPQCRPP